MKTSKNQAKEFEVSINFVKSILAFYRAMSAFESDEASIFANEGELQKIVRGVRENEFKKVKKGAVCLHPGCTSKSVIGSHTIHKATSHPFNGPYSYVFSTRAFAQRAWVRSDAPI